MPTTYHLLTESEPFSEFSGGAISRWVANVVKFDPDAVIVAPASDTSWGFNPSRVRNVPFLASFGRFMKAGGHRLPWAVRLQGLRSIFLPALQSLKEGDAVWVHNRPETAVALQSFVHARGAKLILHLHNSHLIQWSVRLVRMLQADCYVFVSKFLQDEALSKFPQLGRTAVLNNGADPKLFYPAEEKSHGNETPTVLFASRLVPDKGVHIFAEAMRMLLARNVRLRGIIVGGEGFGEGVPTAYIRELREKAPANIEFKPYCSGKPLAAMFRKADMYCLSACWDDPFPLSVLEAMASATPVVASVSGGIPDQLAHGGGILVPRNSPTELATALARLAMNPDLRTALGTAGLRASREYFTWATVHKGYERILQLPAIHASHATDLSLGLTA